MKVAQKPFNRIYRWRLNLLSGEALNLAPLAKKQKRKEEQEQVELQLLRALTFSGFVISKLHVFTLEQSAQEWG